MNNDHVRLPCLLKASGGALHEAGRLHPLSLSATMNLEPLSTADMVLAEDDLPVQMHDFIRLYGQNGVLGIFRVSNISTTYKKERKLRLNHALDLFNDVVIPEEEKISGTISDILTFVLGKQTSFLGGAPYWQLGVVQDTSNYTIENEYGNALDFLQAIAQDRPDYYYTFDFSTFPWTLNFLAKNDSILSEFRLPRNVEKCQVTLDDGEQCTRLYLAVDDGTPTVYNDEAAQAAWGIIAKTESVISADVPDIAAWVQNYFAHHASPSIQITIDGLEINRLTGETLDEMHLGRLCRVALPEYSTVFSERIISICYPDIMRQPAHVTVSLANKRPTASSSFSSLYRRIDVTETGVKKNSYRWEAIDQHVTDIGTILHKAGLEIDAHGVWLYAGEHAEDYALGASFRVMADQINSLVGHYEEIDGQVQFITDTGLFQNREHISLVAGKFDVDADGNVQLKDGAQLSVRKDGIYQTVGTVDEIVAVGSRITTIEGSALWVKRDNITGVVGKMYVDNEGNIHVLNGSGLYLDEGTASLGVYTSGNLTAGIIVNKINGGSVKIQADKVDIEGWLTAHQVTVDGLYSKQNIMASGWIVAGSYVNAPDVQINGASAKKAIVNFGTATESGGKITIPTTTLGGTDGPSINFNIADTQFYKDAVASAGVISSASVVLTGSIYYQGGGVYSQSGTITVVRGNGTSVTKSATVNVTAARDAGRSSVTIPSGGIVSNGALDWTGSGATYPATPSSFDVRVPVKVTADNAASQTATITYDGSAFWGNGRVYGHAQGVAQTHALYTPVNDAYKITSNQYINSELFRRVADPDEPGQYLYYTVGTGFVKVAKYNNLYYTDAGNRPS